MMTNNNPITVLSVFGTRPELIKLFPVLDRLGKISECDNVVVSTAQHREMIDDLLGLFSLEPDYDLAVMQKNQSLADISTRALAGLDPILKERRPDIVLIQGDTTTAFIGALAAFYHRIPVGHVEAGLRSFNKKHPYPEEINRKLISVVGDLHFAPTFQNAKNLTNEGIDREKIFITGNTVVDALLHTSRLNKGVVNDYLPNEAIGNGRLILVTAHRRENWGKPLEDLCHVLKDLTHSYIDVHIVYPVHLNPNVRETVFALLSNQERIHLVDPLLYQPFVELMARSYLIITDSGGIQEEGLSLKKPILVFREVTERPEGISTGGVKLVGTKRENVFREASRLLENRDAYKDMVAADNPYGDGKAAERIVQAILFHFGRDSRPADFTTPFSDRNPTT